MDLGRLWADRLHGVICIVLAASAASWSSTSSCAQCEPEIMGSVGGEPFSSTVVGDLAYVAASAGGLVIADVSDPAAPVQIGQLLFAAPNTWPALAWDVEVSGDVAFVAAYGAGLVIVDVSDPAQPSVITSIEFFFLPEQLDLVDGVLYVIGTSGFMYVVDVTNPARPETVGQVNVGIQTDAVDVEDGIACVVGGGFKNGKLVTVDVTDPSDPFVAGVVSTPGFFGARHVVVDGTTAYAAVGAIGLVVVDVTNPSTPSVIATHFEDLSPRSTHIVDDIAYVTGGDELHIAQIGAPGEMTLIASVQTFFTLLRVATVDAGVAYVSEWGGDLVTVDISKPEQSAVLGRLGFLAGDAVAIRGDYAYVRSSQALRVVDLGDPTAPVIVSSTGISASYLLSSIGLAPGRSIACTAGAALDVIDITVPEAPVVVGSLTLPEHGTAVALRGGYAYVGLYPDGLAIADITDPAAPVLVSSIATPGSARGIAVNGDTVYMANYVQAEFASTLIAIDVTDPATPEIVGSAPMGTLSGQMQIRDDILYTRDAAGYPGPGVFQTFDVHDPTAPTLLGSTDIGYDSFAGAVALDNGLAYVTSFDGLEVVDVRDPAQPVSLGTVSPPNPNGNSGVAAGPGFACFVNEAGLFVADVTSCAFCMGDTDNTGTVDFLDLLAVLSAWGPCSVPCPADVDDNGAVELSDLLFVLSNWGDC